MFFQLLGGLIIGYLLYSFVFRFLLPLIRITAVFRKQIRTFKQQMHSESPAPESSFTPGPKPRSAKKGDYLDFEELP